MRKGTQSEKLNRHIPFLLIDIQRMWDAKRYDKKNNI